MINLYVYEHHFRPISRSVSPGGIPVGRDLDFQGHFLTQELLVITAMLLHLGLKVSLRVPQVCHTVLESQGQVGEELAQRAHPKSGTDLERLEGVMERCGASYCSPPGLRSPAGKPLSWPRSRPPAPRSASPDRQAPSAAQQSVNKQESGI